MYLDMGRSGTFLLYICEVAFWTQETSPRLSDVKRSVVLWSVFVIGSTLTYLGLFQECATPPHIQVRHCTWLSFTRPSPALVLQATNAGVRSPGVTAISRSLAAVSFVSSPLASQRPGNKRNCSYTICCHGCDCAVCSEKVLHWIGSKLLTVDVQVQD